MASDSHVFTRVEDFDFLDHIPYETRYMVGDVQKGQRKWYWISNDVCADLGMAKDFFYNMDMNTGQSEAMEEFHEEIFNKVQLRGETFSKIKTLHVGGKTLHWLQTYKPIRAKFEGWEEERTLFMSTLVDPNTKGENSEKQVEEWALGCELLQHSQGMTMMFDSETSELQYANSKTTSFYTQLLGRQDEGGRELTMLSDVISCVAWASDSAREEFWSRVQAAKVGSEGVEMEGEIVIPRDGDAADVNSEPVYHQFTFTPAFNPVNSRPVLIVNQRDISKLHLQSRQLLDAHREQEAAKQREQFFSAVSHELRTPLNGIIGLSESLIQSPDCTEKMLRTLQVVKSSGQRLASLVNDILDAASRSRGRFVVRRGMVLLREVAQSVCEMVQDMCPQSVQLLQNVEDDVAAIGIEGDSSRIHQVLTNLLSNAIKFTERGQISLHARMLGTEEVVVEVVDSGCGIPQDKWQQVFAPFKQVDMSTTRKYGGTGLGLSLVKELVEAHNGRVGLHASCEGTERGCRFFFVLPVKQPEAGDASEASAESTTANLPILTLQDLEPGVLTSHLTPAQLLRTRSSHPDLAPRKASTETATTIGHFIHAPHQGSHSDPSPATTRVHPSSPPRSPTGLKGRTSARESARDRWSQAQGEEDGRGSERTKHFSELHGTFEILSVDDHQVNHLVVENSLSPKGYTITTCMSAKEALDLLETRGFLPDLILLDVMMPEMSGYEMCAKLREQYPANTLPVIMVSAKSREDDVVKGLQAGCNDYISKPYGSRELNERIDVQFKLKHLWHLELMRVAMEREALLDDEQNRAIARRGGGIKDHGELTVLVCDMCADFARLLHTLPAPEFVALVRALHDRFDAIATARNLTRIVDDAYMLCLDDRGMDAGQQAAFMLDVAAELLEEAQRTSGSAVQTPQVRVGIARGQACSGLVGMKLTKFSIFGPSVRDAVRATLRCPAGCVAVTAPVREAMAGSEAESLFEAWAPMDEDADGSSSGGGGGGGGVGGGDRWVHLARLGACEEALKRREAEGPGSSAEDLQGFLSPMGQLMDMVQAASTLGTEEQLGLVYDVLGQHASEDAEVLRRQTSPTSSAERGAGLCAECEEWRHKYEELQYTVRRPSLILHNWSAAGTAVVSEGVETLVRRCLPS